MKTAPFLPAETEVRGREGGFFADGIICAEGQRQTQSVHSSSPDGGIRSFSYPAGSPING